MSGPRAERVKVSCTQCAKPWEMTRAQRDFAEQRYGTDRFCSRACALDYRSRAVRKGVETVYERYVAGESGAALATELGVTPAVFYRWARRIKKQRSEDRQEAARTSTAQWRAGATTQATESLIRCQITRLEGHAALLKRRAQGGD